MQKVCIFAHFFTDRNKEQKLYDKFVDVLNDILDGEPTPKE